VNAHGAYLPQFAAAHDIGPYTDESVETGIGMEHPMHIKGPKHAIAVRFGTEKSIYFPMLMGIFDAVVTRDSNTRRSSGWGGFRASLLSWQHVRSARTHRDSQPAFAQD
jgi:hypothetical protein